MINSLNKNYLKLVFSTMLFISLSVVYAQTEDDFRFTENATGDGIIITEYIGKRTKGTQVRIPATIQGKPVKEIGDNAFKNPILFGLDDDITSIIIPQGVTVIGNHAFYLCGDLQTITIPEGVTDIGYWAFDGCKKLSSITLPKSLTSMGDSVFSGCSSLKTVTFNTTNLTIIPIAAFSGCISLTRVVIPEGVVTIDENAFSYCLNITTVVLPATIKEIAHCAFAVCSALTTITIPDSVTSIQFDDVVFLACTKLNGPSRDALKKRGYQGRF